MKFQRTSLILVFLAIALGGFVYYQEFRQPKTEEAQSTSKPIFNFKEADVTSFTVKTSKQPTLAFERKPGVVPSVWQMTAPQPTQADDGAVAFLLNLLATGRSDRTLTIPTTRKSEFGLDRPSATVEVKLANQQVHQFVLGKPNFNRNFLYALADPPANTPANTNGELAVLLVPIDFQNAVDRPLDEWKKEKPKKDSKATSSPSPSSPTSSSSPSPASSPAPSPSPSASSSPIPSPTPQTSVSPTPSSPPAPQTSVSPTPSSSPAPSQ
ncbi:MAG: DUF4340 domain-containing protein [Myxacorys chilensis ATA2-1-KO14]|jgi:hypothetical protein|nr:DUF4340 domain-containing protein [Myxacorys chilensis ATA2-1-KO14]